MLTRIAKINDTEQRLMSVTRVLGHILYKQVKGMVKKEMLIL